MSLLNPMDDDQLDAIIQGLERVKELEAEVARLRLTDAERDLLRRLGPSADPRASYWLSLSPEDRRTVHGLLERLK